MEKIRCSCFGDLLMYLVNGFWLYLAGEILPKVHEVSRKSWGKALEIVPYDAYLSLTTQAQAEIPDFQRFIFFPIKPVPTIIVPESEILGLSFTKFSLESGTWWNS